MSSTWPTSLRELASTRFLSRFTNSFAGCVLLLNDFRMGLHNTSASKILWTQFIMLSQDIPNTHGGWWKKQEENLKKIWGNLKGFQNNTRKFDESLREIAKNVQDSSTGFPESLRKIFWKERKIKKKYAEKRGK